MNARQTIDYMKSLEWKEVSMTQALKMWANSHYHIKCEEGSAIYFYHGQETIKHFEQSQVLKGKWFVQVK